MNQSNNVTDIFLKKIKECDQENITKLNKICPIVFQRQKKDDKYNQNLKDKFTEKSSTDALRVKLDIDEMKSDLNNSGRIFKEYENSASPDKYGRYREGHEDYKEKYWDKFQQDKFLCRNKYDYKEVSDKYKEKELHYQKYYYNISG